MNKNVLLMISKVQLELMAALVMVVVLVALIVRALVVLKISFQASLAAEPLGILMHPVRVMIFNIVLIYNLKKLFLEQKKKCTIIVKQAVILVMALELNQELVLLLVANAMVQVLSIWIPKRHLV